VKLSSIVGTTSAHEEVMRRSLLGPVATLIVVGFIMILLSGCGKRIGSDGETLSEFVFPPTELSHVHKPLSPEKVVDHLCARNVNDVDPLFFFQRFSNWMRKKMCVFWTG